jgi:hypothetical protein
MLNPYYEIVKSLDQPQAPGQICEYTKNTFRMANMMAGDSLRLDLCKRYAFSIPDRNAIDFLLRFSPIVEIGAGTGYWAAMVHQCGGEIACIDKDPAPPPLFYPVLQASHRIVRHHFGKTLLVAWPNMQIAERDEMMSYYRGEMFLYIGETDCEFWDPKWQIMESIVPEIRWYGCNDIIALVRKS